MSCYHSFSCILHLLPSLLSMSFLFHPHPLSPFQSLSLAVFISLNYYPLQTLSLAFPSFPLIQFPFSFHIPRLPSFLLIQYPLQSLSLLLSLFLSPPLPTFIPYLFVFLLSSSSTTPFNPSPLFFLLCSPCPFLLAPPVPPRPPHTPRQGLTTPLMLPYEDPAARDSAYQYFPSALCSPLCLKFAQELSPRSRRNLLAP